MRTFERRVFPAQGCRVIRADEKTGELQFRGRPWVYDQLSEDMGGWQEVIRPGAASRTLERNPDVRFLINHDANLLLARTVSGTLDLSEDDEGGIAEARMANVSYARDLAELIDRQDLTQMSFGFWITADGWSGNLHEVREFDLDGGDVSAVTFPAFPQTSSELRSAARRNVGEGFKDLAEQISQAPIVDLTPEGVRAFLESLTEDSGGQAPVALPDDMDPTVVRAAIDVLNGLIPEPGLPLERARWHVRHLENLSRI